jgi:hypothetical protein
MQHNIQTSAFFYLIPALWVGAPETRNDFVYLRDIMIMAGIRDCFISNTMQNIKPS